MDCNQLQWARSQAYQLQHSTNAAIKAARSSAFTAFAMLALEQMTRDHNRYSALHQVYSDLLCAWFIADHAAPITMDRLSFGEFVRWYETTVMPTWDQFDPARGQQA